MGDTYVRCVVVETETEVPGLALIQLHDDQPPIHYVPLVDLVSVSLHSVRENTGARLYILDPDPGEGSTFWTPIRGRRDG